MTKSITSLLCGATLAAGLFASFQAAAAPPALIYAVTVKTSFGTKFKDCWTFQGGTLTISDLGPLVYTAAPSDPKHFYTALTSLAVAQQLGDTFAFAGFRTGTATSGKFAAVGADDVRDSYEIRGIAVTACPALPAPKTNLYKPAQ